MLFADLEVKKGGRVIGRLSPAKFIYQSPPQTTTEVGLLRGLSADLYTVLAVADPQTKRATFTFHVNPFVSWIWLGLLTLIGGCAVSLWPEVGLERATAWRFGRAALAGATGVVLTILFAQSLAQPFAGKWAQPGSAGDSPVALVSARAGRTAP